VPNPENRGNVEPRGDWLSRAGFGRVPTGANPRTGTKAGIRWWLGVVFRCDVTRGCGRTARLDFGSIGPNFCPIWSLSDHHGQRKGSPRSSRPPRGHPCPKTGQRSPIVTEFAGAPPLEPSRPTPLPRRCPVLVPVPISAGSSTRPVPLPVDARFGLRTNKSGLLYAAPRTLGARVFVRRLSPASGGCRRPASGVWVPGR
jgi:hypothetical protein